MFCLYNSSKLSRPQFDFSLKVKVMELNPGYLISSFLLYFLYLIINQPESFKNGNVFGTKYKINEAMRKLWFDDLLCYNAFTKIGTMLLNR